MDNITLQKPLETDIYDINVFNNNSTTIENAVNTLNQKLEEDKITLTIVDK